MMEVIENSRLQTLRKSAVSETARGVSRHTPAGTSLVEGQEQGIVALCEEHFFGERAALGR